MVAVSRVVMSGVRRMGSKGAGGGSAASTKEDGGHYPSMMDNMFEAACTFDEASYNGKGPALPQRSSSTLEM